MQCLLSSPCERNVQQQQHLHSPHSVVRTAEMSIELTCPLHFFVAIHIGIIRALFVASRNHVE